MVNKDLFSDFPPVSKAEWLQKVAKDLKTTKLEDLEWDISDDLRLSPFVHADDFASPPTPLGSNASAWEICENIRVDDPESANAQALEALNGGAASLELEFSSPPDWPTFELALAGVQLDFIGLHFTGPGAVQNPSNIFLHLLRLAKVSNIDTQALRGSIAYDPLRVGGIVDWRYLVDLLEFAQTSFPHFKIISVGLAQHNNPTVALGKTLRKANEYLIKLNERGIAPAKAMQFIQFSMPIGKSYFLEIAKTRALKLLWINVLKGWEAPLHYPGITAYFKPEAYTDDLYSNMIRATTMSMSAVLGGATQLCVLPYDAGRSAAAAYPAAFGRRIARNVQHLMKMESALDELDDPAAGSYYIEKLTTLLADKAWSEFRQALKES